MGYNIPYSSDNLSDVFAVVAGIILVIVAIVAIMAVVFYIFEAIALYTIAKKRGIANAWISFIPIVNKYMVGAIADNINSYVNKRTSYRIYILILGIANLILGGIVNYRYMDAMLREGGLFMLTADPSLYSQKMLLLSGISGLVGLISIAYLVFYYIALYRIFVDYNQRNAVMFLVLSILFKGLGLPYCFLFSLRNKPSASLYYAQQMQQTAMQYQPQQPNAQQPMQTTTENEASNPNFE